jgi:uncharacterized protein YjbJ (UPF0337 family)
MLNTDIIQGKWKELRGKVKERWGQLTDDDLDIASGQFDQLVGRIQMRTGETREQIEKFFSDLGKVVAEKASWPDGTGKVEEREFHKVK